MILYDKVQRCSLHNHSIYRYDDTDDCTDGAYCLLVHPCPSVRFNFFSVSAAAFSLCDLDHTIPYATAKVNAAAAR
jgi:hypothetical protein